MTLVARQNAFYAEITADDDAEFASSIGMEIYRNAYRARLLNALENSFERTRLWVGQAVFEQAACHYILTHPPQSWTLDAYGAYFPDILADLFVEDPEVSELAWLEWHMQRAFTAPDLPELNRASLHTAGYTDSDWDRAYFAMASGFSERIISTNCTELWVYLAKGQSDPNFAVHTIQNANLLVWRSQLSPRFYMLDSQQIDVLHAIMQKETLGQIGERVEAQQLGNWLAQWFDLSIFSEVLLTEPPMSH